MSGLGVLRAREAALRALGAPGRCSGAGLRWKHYLYHPLQAAQRGLEMLILLGAEAGDLGVLGEGSREGRSSSGLPSRARLLSPTTRKGKMFRNL